MNKLHKQVFTSSWFKGQTCFIFIFSNCFLNSWFKGIWSKNKQNQQGNAKVSVVGNFGVSNGLHLACSRLRDSRVRGVRQHERENKTEGNWGEEGRRTFSQITRSYFREPFSYASSLPYVWEPGTGYNQLQKYLRHCTVFWHEWPVYDLVLVTPLHPLSRLLAIQDHTQNLEEQLWMGGRRVVSIVSHRPVTRSDLKQERWFFRGSVSTFLQLVVAYILMARSDELRGSKWTVWHIPLYVISGENVWKLFCLRIITSKDFPFLFW